MISLIKKKLTELYSIFISDKFFSSPSDRNNVITAYQTWVEVNRPLYAKYFSILAMLFMAILIPFDFLLFSNGAYYAQIRVIFIIVILLNIIILDKQRERVSKNKLKDYPFLVLFFPGLLFCLIYEYWLLIANSESYGTVLIANYMVIFFTTVFLYRFWKEQYLINVISIVGLISLPFIKMELLVDCVLLIIFHLSSAVLAFFFRRQFVSSMYVHNLKKVQKELQDEVEVARHKAKIILKLEASEEKYRTLFSSIADPVFIFDRDTNHFLECNQAVLNLYGYTRKEILAMTLTDLHPRKDKNIVQENINNDLNKDHHYTHLTKAGLEKQVEVHTEAINFQGQPAWVSIVHDITEREQAEEALKESEEKYRMLVENAHDGIEITQDDKIIYTNLRFAEMLGYTVDELKNIPFNRIFTEQATQELHERDRKRQADKPVPNKYETTIRKKDGTFINVDVKYEIIDYAGKLATFAIIRDITNQKKEERLQSVLYEISQAASTTTNLDELYQAIHNQLTKVIDTTNFFIALIDTDNNMMSFPYYVDEYDDPPDPIELTKRTISEYVTQTGMPLYFKEKEIRELADMGMIDLDYSGTISKIWLGSPLQIKNKSIGVIVVQSYHDPDLYSESDLDILNFVSEQVAIAIARKQANEFTRESENKYRLLSEQLTEANIMKELLLDVITHDLKNPAGVISGMADIGVDENPENEVLQLIKESSDSLLQVINNATVLSKVALEEGIDKEELDLVQMIEKMKTEFESILKNAGMNLEFELPDRLIIKANPILAEVFKNYVSNAIKYAFDGEKIIIGGKIEANHFVVTVVDFGQSIPAEEYENIFKRSIQLSRDKRRGRGLGLAIVKRIADAHDAEVGVKSNEPTGNIFYIKIPI